MKSTDIDQTQFQVNACHASALDQETNARFEATKNSHAAAETNAMTTGGWNSATTPK
jgi:hypothetical protein